MPRQHLKQRPDGRYACWYKKNFFIGNTQAQVLAAREAFKLAEKQGMKKDAAHTTVREYAASWLPVHKHSVSNKCYNDYAKQLDVLIDIIGDMILQDVRPSDIQRIWLHYDGYSNSTIKRARQLFYSMFDTACDDGYIRTNPMKSQHSKPPKGFEGTHRAITDAERDLIHANSDHWFHPAIMLMLYAGLRRGEVLALDIDRDIDYINKVIYVRYAVRYDSNQPIVSDPKTEAGKRTIPMVSVLQECLRGLHGLAAPARQSGGLMSQSAFKSAWNSYFKQINCRLNGVNQQRWADKSQPWQSISIRPHDLRHSYCTMLRDAGVDLKLAMQWMGHADEKMILRIYDHVNDFRKQQAMNQIEKLLSNSQNNSQIDSHNRRMQ